MAKKYIHTPRFVRTLQSTLKSIPMAFGIELYKHTEDRQVLEEVIFPYFVPLSQFSKILFVGCAWYTRGYRAKFKNKDYQTLEIDPAESKYGAKKHIIDSIENINHHFHDGELDLIICNGVFGWGLNEKTSIEEAFQGCYRSLRPGGVFILGWNDIPLRCPLLLSECEGLQLFQPFVFPPLATAQYLVANSSRHTYNFFIKT
jgi:SAM-dependent methyltransferase